MFSLLLIYLPALSFEVGYQDSQSAKEMQMYCAWYERDHRGNCWMLEVK